MSKFIPLRPAPLGIYFESFRFWDPRIQIAFSACRICWVFVGSSKKIVQVVIYDIIWNLWSSKLESLDKIILVYPGIYNWVDNKNNIRVDTEIIEVLVSISRDGRPKCLPITIIIHNPHKPIPVVYKWVWVGDRFVHWFSFVKHARKKENKEDSEDAGPAFSLY